MSESSATINETLREALEQQKLRYFRASRGSAKGKTGTADTEKFAESLMVLQECALLLGEKMEMNAVSYAVVHEANETTAFCFDPNSHPQNPEVVGGIVNKKMAMREVVSSLRDYINQ